MGQTTSDERIRGEVVSSFDLFADLPLGRGLIHAYVEGNTTPFSGGVSRIVGEANTDAGTALNRRRRGRVQISELRLVWPLGGDVRAHVGLLDATGFLDVSRIANDENLFFLGVPFVNNPTIEFPDYALGAVVEGSVPGSRNARVAVVATSSHGLADNPGVSYAQLLDVRERGKGMFAGGTIRHVGEGHRLAIGAWINTARHPYLADQTRAASSRGVFGVAGMFRGPHSVSLRLGLANDEVSLARAYTGITYLWARRPDALGVALGHSFRSSSASGAGDVTHAELFLRRRLVGDVFITASVQRIVNAGFDPTDSLRDRRLWIPGVRLSAQF